MSTAEEKSEGELWIGLAKVGEAKVGLATSGQTSEAGVLGGCEGAYTNAIARAVSKDNFRIKVKAGVAELGLFLARLEGAETLNARLAKHSVDPELTKVADEVMTTGGVGFGTFHAFGGNVIVESPALDVSN